MVWATEEVWNYCMEIEEGKYFSIEGNSYILEERAGYGIVSMAFLLGILGVFFTFISIKIPDLKVLMVSIPMILLAFYVTFNWKEVVFDFDTRNLIFRRRLWNHYYGKTKLVAFPDGLQVWVHSQTDEEGNTSHALWAKAAGKEVFISGFDERGKAERIIDMMQEDQPSLATKAE